jgi:hypothetical protein
MTYGFLVARPPCILFWELTPPDWSRGEEGSNDGGGAGDGTEIQDQWNLDLTINTIRPS